MKNLTLNSDVLDNYMKGKKTVFKPTTINVESSKRLVFVEVKSS